MEVHNANLEHTYIRDALAHSKMASSNMLILQFRHIYFDILQLAQLTFGIFFSILVHYREINYSRLYLRKI